MLSILLTSIIILNLFAMYPTVSNPLSEDLNGNVVPDIVEMHKISYQPAKIPSFTVVSTIVTIVFIVVVQIVSVVSKNEVDYRTDFDILVKLFKSKFKEVV